MQLHSFCFFSVLIVKFRWSKYLSTITFFKWSCCVLCILVNKKQQQYSILIENKENDFLFLVGTKPYKNIKMKSPQKSKQNNSSKLERRSELSNLTFYCF